MILGTGVDITEVKRLKKAIGKWGDAFLKRVFTETELKNAQTRGCLYQHLAGRFAAKEAVFKAMGNSDLTWHDLNIVNDKEGRPFVKVLNSKGEGVRVSISISHVKDYAVANAIVTKKT